MRGRAPKSSKTRLVGLGRAGCSCMRSVRHVVGGYVAAVAGSGALIGAIARAGTAARKCFQLNSSVWASVGKCLEASLTGEVNVW